MSNDSHGRGGAPGLVFTQGEPAAPTHAERARTLIAQHKVGALSSLALEPAGYPYASFITFSLDAGEPVFLISRMAEHTRNLLADSRGSLLVHDSDKQDPLANGRVTLLGKIEKVERPAERERAAYLAVHPTAEYYVEFTDFDFFRMRLEALRYIGGYGRMSWVDAPAFRAATPDPLAAASSGILSHMKSGPCRRAGPIRARIHQSAGRHVRSDDRDRPLRLRDDGAHATRHWPRAPRL
jgi:putative heme iron utilization protein